MKSLIVVPLLLLSLARSSLGFDKTVATAVTSEKFLKLEDKYDTPEVINIVPIDTCFQDSSTQSGGKAVKYTTVWTHAYYSAANTADANKDFVEYTIETYYNSDCSDASPISSVRILAQSIAMKNNANTNELATDIGYNGLVTAAGPNAVSGSEATYAVPAGYAQHAASILNTAALAEDVTDPSSDYVMQLFYSDSSCTSGNFKGANMYLKAANIASAGTDVADGSQCIAKLAANLADMTTLRFLTTDLGVVQKFSDDTPECVNSKIVYSNSSAYASQAPIGLDTVAYDLPATNYGKTSCDQVASSRWVSGLPTIGAYMRTAGYAQDSTPAPTSMPTFTAESYGQTTWDVKKRHRVGGLCENGCSGHGSCVVNQNCLCYTGMDGEPEWTGPDCSLRTCPRDYAWVGDVVNANDLHPWAECSNRGSCDRKTGICSCYPGYDGVACQRFACPNNCNERGTCWPEKHLAVKASRVYDSPWDAMKAVGCLCDAGYRGPSCEFQECPSGADPLDGYGNEAGRDCSGRGLCDYGSGTCNCFSGFYGTRCQYQTTLM